jgi:L-seryl-tRNA(Ser) seleniumtransferase
MQIDKQRLTLLKKLPGVDKLLEIIRKESKWRKTPNSVILNAIRKTLDNARSKILDPNSTGLDLNVDAEQLLVQIYDHIKKANSPNLKAVINATGIVIHTNLGRSLLAEPVLNHLYNISKHYSNLEFDLEKGLRGSRYSLVEDLLCEISGADAAMVVNNNAGAVLLCLDTMASGKEVVVSRGELVEIGGAFRIPDVMTKSGARLKEVGTTNRTHLRDYENAIDEHTGLLLKVHTSNYSIIGFTASVSLAQMVSLGHKHGLPVMEDLGSGTFIDFSRYGLAKEPTVQESVAAGVHLITFSGDKLLGGPQAGIIIGNKKLIAKIKSNPLTRALRIDKLTLAALESTLRFYRDEATAVRDIPTLAMLTTPLEVITARAEKINAALKQIICDKGNVMLLDLTSRVGGGALPLLNLPSKCIGVTLKEISPNAIERFLRRYSPAIIGRIETDQFILDPRTIQDNDIAPIKTAFAELLTDLHALS